MMEIKETNDFHVVAFKSDTEWHELRGKGIGGSDASIVLNVNQYKTAYELWEEKTGTKERVFITNDAIEKGNRCEDPMLQLFGALHPEYEIIDTKNITLISKYWEPARANLDGVLVDSNGVYGIYEGKTATIQNMGIIENWKDKVPDSYFYQVLHYLAVTQYDYAIIYALLDFPFWNKQELRTYEFYRNDYLQEINFLVSEEVNFWNNYVVPKVEPPIIRNIIL